jgi:hypothetical protein
VNNLILLETVDQKPIYMSEGGLSFSLTYNAKHKYRAEYPQPIAREYSVKEFIGQAAKQLGLKVQIENDPAPSLRGKPQ